MSDTKPDVPQPHATAAAAAEHHPRLVRNKDVAGQVHGFSAVGRFNTTAAVLITKSVGTMWCAYVFTVIGITGIVAALTGNTTLVLLVGAVSGYFLQLVLLPVIIVGQNVISTAQDARAEADHETLTILHQINVQQLRLLEHQSRIIELLDKEKG